MPEFCTSAYIVYNYIPCKKQTTHKYILKIEFNIFSIQQPIVGKTSYTNRLFNLPFKFEEILGLIQKYY